MEENRVMNRLIVLALLTILFAAWAVPSDGGEVYRVTLEIPGLAAPC